MAHIKPLSPPVLRDIYSGERSSRSVLPSFVVLNCKYLGCDCVCNCTSGAGEGSPQCSR